MGASMPRDWNDHAGWDEHYRDRLKTRDFGDMGYLPWGAFSDLARHRAQQGVRTVWLPGCGLSALGQLLAHLGFEVFATDASKVAIRLQNIGRWDFEPEYGPPVPGGSFTAEVHDFREEYRTEAFDWIMNMRAIQGLRDEHLMRAAHTHAQALRPGREAYFETWNLMDQGVETALQAAGFTIGAPYLARWRALQLIKTNLRGLSMYGNLHAYRHHDEILRRVYIDYHENRHEDEADRQRREPMAKTAVVFRGSG